MASLVVSQLLFLESDNPEKHITMYINSPGGVITAGLAIYDTMQVTRPPLKLLLLSFPCPSHLLLMVVHSKPGSHCLHWPGCQYGVIPSGRGGQGASHVAPALPDHDSPTQRRHLCTDPPPPFPHSPFFIVIPFLLGTSSGGGNLCQGDPEDEGPPERPLCQAHRPNP